MGDLMDHARRLVRRYPSLRRVLQQLYRGGQYGVGHTMRRLRGEPLALLFVDPNAIEYTVAPDDPTLRGSGTWHFGTAAAGDWDLNGVSVREHGGVYTILAQRVEEERPLPDIPTYRANLAAIERGAVVDSCTTSAEYAARWQAIEALYHTIARDGYRTQAELGSANPLDEIRVQVGRAGALLFEEGLHRLAIAQLLALPQVPVIVTRRHAEWDALRRAVVRIAIQRGFFHQPFGHPDLDSINTLYGKPRYAQAVYGHERWDFIRDSLPFSSGSVLDIGAYFGYFDHRLEALGYDCHAVEPDLENLEVLRRWRDMRGCRFEIVPQPIFVVKRTEFDIVLALNIFHHLVRTREDYEGLVAFLQRLRCRALYLEPDDNHGVDAYQHFDDAEFIQFVQQHTGLTEARLLGRAREGRNVYLLTQ